MEDTVELTTEEQDHAVYVAMMREQLADLEANPDRGAAKRRIEEVRARLAELEPDERVAGAAKSTRLRDAGKETR